MSRAGEVRPVALVLGPAIDAVSGVSMHVKLLLASPLAERFELAHFQVGSEGRNEGRLALAARIAGSPFSLAREIVLRRAALVHVNTSLSVRGFLRDFAYLGVARLCGARAVFQVHGGQLARFASGPLRRAAARLAARLADVVVVLSEAERREWSALSPRRLELVPNGIEVRSLPRPPREPGAPFELLYVGRLARRKGLDETLEALEAVRRRGVAARLTLVGAGPEEQRLRARARRLGLGPAVRFAGPAFGRRKAELLAAADALVLASETEGLPYALLEAMAAGAVPIATPVGAIPDTVRDGMHGLLVPVRDPAAIAHAIERLAADPAAAERMREAAQGRAAAVYSLERMAADFCRIYSRLCSDPKAWTPLDPGTWRRPS